MAKQQIVQESCCFPFFQHKLHAFDGCLILMSRLGSSARYGNFNVIAGANFWPSGKKTDNRVTSPCARLETEFDHSLYTQFIGVALWSVVVLRTPFKMLRLHDYLLIRKLVSNGLTESEPQKKTWVWQVQTMILCSLQLELWRTLFASVQTMFVWLVTLLPNSENTMQLFGRSQKQEIQKCSSICRPIASNSSSV